MLVFFQSYSSEQDKSPASLNLYFSLFLRKVTLDIVWRILWRCMTHIKEFHLKDIVLIQCTIWWGSESVICCWIVNLKNSWRKTMYSLLSHSFSGSGVQIWFNWVSCSGSHKATSRCCLGSILLWSLGSLPNSDGCWKHLVPLVVDLCFFCFLSTRQHSPLLETTWSSLLPDLLTTWLLTNEGGLHF